MPFLRSDKEFNIARVKYIQGVGGEGVVLEREAGVTLCKSSSMMRMNVIITSLWVLMVKVVCPGLYFFKRLLWLL